MKYQPIIKWSGSKRSQADEIIQYFPDKIDTYYEPFCGGASMMRKLIDSDIKVEHIRCSDINADLISCWNKVFSCPDTLLNKYTNMWNELNSKENIDEKRKYFEEMRFTYNMTHDPYIFFFIMRTCTNGMPRYNRKGEFNNSFHITRNGITPDNLRPILHEWFKSLHRKDVEFTFCDYSEVFEKCKKGDLLYLDPPYYNTKGMYYGYFDFDKFFDGLRKLNEKGVKWIMSFDGKSGSEDNTCTVIPEGIYKEHVYIKSGNSSFKRVTGNDKHAMVYESLYMNFKPDKEKGLW